MNRIIVFSGPCGSGKSTLSDEYARLIVRRSERIQAYVIHGDVFHRGFIETDRPVGPCCPGFQYWPDILRFNWECILSTAQKALNRGLDVIIDYVVEDELPLLRELAVSSGARLFYVVLSISEEELERRLTLRGSSGLIDRSRFLRKKLESDPVHRAFLYCTEKKTAEQAAYDPNLAAYEIPLSR